VHIKAAIGEKLGGRLVTAIDRAMRESGRTLEQALTWAALTVAQSARAIAKPGERYHKIHSNPEYRQANVAWRWAERRRKEGLPIPAEAEAALRQIGELELAPRFVRFLHQLGYKRDVPTCAY
jgi:hypothetical protein